MTSIQLTDDDGVRTIAINRPERRNAVDVVTAGELHDAFVAADADNSVSVMILTGVGGAFCAGADRPTPTICDLHNRGRWAGGSATSSRFRFVVSTIGSSIAAATKRHGGKQ